MKYVLHQPDAAVSAQSTLQLRRKRMRYHWFGTGLEDTRLPLAELRTYNTSGGSGAWVPFALGTTRSVSGDSFTAFQFGYNTSYVGSGPFVRAIYITPEGFAIAGGNTNSSIYEWTIAQLRSYMSTLAAEAAGAGLTETQYGQSDSPVAYSLGALVSADLAYSFLGFAEPLLIDDPSDVVLSDGGLPSLDGFSQSMMVWNAGTAQWNLPLGYYRNSSSAHELVASVSGSYSWSQFESDAEGATISEAYETILSRDVVSGGVNTSQRLVSSYDDKLVAQYVGRLSTVPGCDVADLKITTRANALTLQLVTRENSVSVNGSGARDFPNLAGEVVATNYLTPTLTTQPDGTRTATVRLPLPPVGTSVYLERLTAA